MSGRAWWNRRPTRLVTLVAVVGAIAACYGPFLRRGFTSEDFLLIRFLGEHPPWRGFWSGLDEPWLGIAGIRFFRPISTLLYGGEIALFGTQAWAYNTVHVALHAGNALALAAIARRLVGPPAALAAGLLFALYPLHPNAVLFSASFATLFAAGFLLAAFACYLRWRRRRTRWSFALALLLYALALGSYEAAAVFPLWLVAYEHLLGRQRESHGRRARAYLPFAALLVCYLLFRRWALGTVLGGYEDLGARFLQWEVGSRLRDLAVSLHQLQLPIYRAWPGPWAIAISALALIGLPLAGLLWLARTKARGRWALRRWLFGVVFLVSNLAPFAFQPSVPGNGRYWYLASGGVALMLGALVLPAARVLPARWRRLPALGVAVVVVVWSWLLIGYLRAYRDAADLATELQAELVVHGAAATAPLFVAGHPLFVMEAGTPVAQVFHYGLWDAVHPPFSSAQVPAYPLPALADSDLAPLWSRGAPGRLWRWDEGTRQLREVPIPPAAPAEILIVRPPIGPRLDPLDAESLRFAFAAAPGARRYRLVAVTRGNPTLVELSPTAAGQDLIGARLPADFLFTMRRLYGGEVFWWLEGRDDSDRLVAQSRMQQAELARP